MKTCKNCGASINDDSRFCTQCGADTFESGAVEETVVNVEASAQPETDNTEIPAQGGEYYNPEGDNTVGGGEYYQPATADASGSASSYTYTVPADQEPVGKGKKKGRVWAIVLAVIIVLGFIGRFGLKIADIVFDVLDNKTSISDGSVSLSGYTNDSLNLNIDVSGSNFKIASEDELSSYFNVNPDDYETVIYNYSTGEILAVCIFKGSATEIAQSVEEFARAEAEYYYKNETNYKISDVYEREIAGKTYTCVDISQAVEDEEYGDYYTEETLCIIKDGSTFVEIQIVTYPEETGRNAQNIIDQYFKAIK